MVATVVDPNFLQATASGTMTIGQAAATVTLGNLNFTYDGSPKSVTVSTNPPGLAVSITYDGLSTAPINVGTCIVEAHVTDPNFSGSASGTMTIGAATAAAVPALGPWGLLAAACGLLGLVAKRRI